MVPSMVVADPEMEEMDQETVETDQETVEIDQEVIDQEDQVKKSSIHFEENCICISFVSTAVMTNCFLLFVYVFSRRLDN